MANGKQGSTTAAPKPKADKSPAQPATDAKSQVKRMFGNEEQPILRVEADLVLPEHAEPGGEASAKDAKDAVDAILSALGTEAFPATQFPVPKNRNNGVEAVNYVLWDHVSKFADKKAKAASKAAEENGVFGDAASYVAGETAMVYSTPEFAISIKKGDDTQMINRELVEAVLKEVAPNKWQDLMKRCMKPRAGPVQRIVSLK
jgi:hypothetical protein